MLRKLLLLTLLVAACGSAGATTAPSAPPSVAPTSAATAEPSMAAAETIALSAEGYLVGPDGMTLYTFDVDDPGVSNCEGECLANWPPLLVESADGMSVGAGLDDGEFSTITRSDGTTQVAHNSQPLYYFVGDTAPGDTNGDGVNDVWHLATADGGAASTDEPTSTDEATEPPIDDYY